MRAIYLMARREYLSYVATWGFWLSIASMPLFMLIGAAIPLLAESSQPDRYYVVINETQLDDLPETIEVRGFDFESGDSSTEGSRFIPVPAPGRSIEELRPFLLGEELIDVDGEQYPLFAAIIFRAEGEFGVTADYWSENLTNSGLRSSLRRALRDYVQGNALADAGISAETLAEIEAMDPEVRELSPERGRDDAAVTGLDRIPFIVGIFFAGGLWLMVFSVTNMLLTAMIEEKGNKILDTLLATARYHEILIGKLLGLAAVSATFILIWGALGSGGLLSVSAFAQSANIPVDEILSAVFNPALIIPAAGYFIVGYLMYGTVFLAVGSLCDTLQEAQSLMSPIMLMMMVPIIVMVVSFESLDSQFAQIASWVPIWTPFLMMARLQADPSSVELIATTIAMLVTAAAVIGLASYVFRQGSMGRANANSIRSLFGGKAKSS